MAPLPAQGEQPAPAAVERPLAVTIDTLTPSYLPARGPVRLTGSVTNNTGDRWVAINTHVFISDTPITSSEELEEQAALDPEEPVGERITVPGTFATIDSLEPGESSQFSIEISRSRLGVEAPGVYWFGVHALGEADEPRDEVADGRARTFVPLVPPRTRDSVDTALVIPIRREVRYTRDGSLSDVEGWARALDIGGSLRSLVDFGAAAGSTPVTWLVDPAVPDAVRHLVAGNRPRSLEDTVEPEGPGDEESPTPEPTEETPADETDDEESGAEPPPANLATEPGLAWLDRFGEALEGDQILALPYGDLDMSAAARRDPEMYRRARRAAGTDLQPWDLPTTPAIAAPGGYLSPDAIRIARKNSTFLVSDRMFGENPPAAARFASRTLTITSAAAAEGGPGPDDPLAPLAVRQRILSEAALRVLDGGTQPLVVVMPPQWNPDSTTGFFDGLDVDWLNLAEVDDLDPPRATEIENGGLDYPTSQIIRELDAANFVSAQGLIGLGGILENVLARNDAVASEVLDQSLNSLSFSSREHPQSSRAETDRSRRWISAQLASIRVEAPPAVTLSSSTGRFSATITNQLDHPVRVRVASDADAPLSIEDTDVIEVAAGGRSSVLLEAATDRLGVHNVQLIVTSEDGTPLGSSDSLPIRSAQVSDVIWLILGTGVALLFGAILVRLVRRIRQARRARA